MKNTVNVVLAIGAGVVAAFAIKSFMDSRKLAAASKLAPNPPAVPEQKEVGTLSQMEEAKSNSEFNNAVGDVKKPVKKSWLGGSNRMKFTVHKSQPCPPGCKRYVGAGDTRICSCAQE